MAKWLRYTSLTKLSLKLHTIGNFSLSLYGHNAGESEAKLIETILINQEYQTISLDVNKLPFQIIGFSLHCLSDEGFFLSGEYCGEFSSWKDNKIGIAICTYKREKYITQNIEKLSDFTKQHSWLNILVIDNGQTLTLRKEPQLQIIHNENYGGAGGFTRGILEYLDKDSQDYILLMDDDIEIELSALERTSALINGLKQEYKRSFISGAMLRIEAPTIQYENKAFWNKFRIFNIGKEIDLSVFHNLSKNEEIIIHPNMYAAWWYCCIPIKQIKNNGLPLPIFLKGDDMEYGIRNKKEVISLNGISVWHQSFETKVNQVVNYYSDRNSLMMNHFADRCNFGTFFIAVMARLIKRLLKKDLSGLKMYAKALRDYHSGLENITRIGSDKFMQQVIDYSKESVSWKIIPYVLYLSVKVLIFYSKDKNKYRSFIHNYLKTDIFWKNFLKMEK